MKERISGEEVPGPDKVWHDLIISMQKSGEWKPDIILKEIVEILGIPGSTLTSAVDRLEKRRLLRRAISQRDRRSFGLELTDEGRIAQQEHRDSEKFCGKKFGAYSSAAERRKLIRPLQILADNLNGRAKKYTIWAWFLIGVTVFDVKRTRLPGGYHSGSSIFRALARS